MYWQWGILAAVGFLLTNGGPSDPLLVRHLVGALSAYLAGASFAAVAVDCRKWLNAP